MYVRENVRMKGQKEMVCLRKSVHASEKLPHLCVREIVSSMRERNCLIYGTGLGRTHH